MSRSHQRAEHILKNLQQEEEKRRLGREASIITAIPVAQEACYEPTCSPPPEQEEEGGAARRMSTCVLYKKNLERWKTASTEVPPVAKWELFQNRVDPLVLTALKSFLQTGAKTVLAFWIDYPFSPS